MNPVGSILGSRHRFRVRPWSPLSRKEFPNWLYLASGIPGTPGNSGLSQGIRVTRHGSSKQIWCFQWIFSQKTVECPTYSDRGNTKGTGWWPPLRSSNYCSGIIRIENTPMVWISINLPSKKPILPGRGFQGVPRKRHFETGPEGPELESWQVEIKSKAVRPISFLGSVCAALLLISTC